MKDDMPRFCYLIPEVFDASSVLLVGAVIVVIALMGVLNMQDRLAREDEDRLRNPFQYLDQDVKVKLLKSDPEFYGRIFKDLK